MMVIIERPTFKLSDLLTCSKAVILDGIQDPGNLGTIIRSMVAFGVDVLCLTNDCVDVFHPKAVNASSGALADIKIYNESHWADWLPTVPHPVYVLDPVGSSLVHNVSKKKMHLFWFVDRKAGDPIKVGPIHTINACEHPYDK